MCFFVKLLTEKSSIVKKPELETKPTFKILTKEETLIEAKELHIQLEKMFSKSTITFSKSNVLSTNTQNR